MDDSVKILVIDNYDSFTFNLVHLIESLDVSFEVRRNDELLSIPSQSYSHLLIGPGPGLPNSSGVLIAFLKLWPNDKPVLGVCLGMQALLTLEEAQIRNLVKVYHGACEPVHVLKSSKWMHGIPSAFMAGRYHSWGFLTDDIPSNYAIVAEDAEKNVMAIEHKVYPWFGVQYHPESIMTEFGDLLIRNFIATRKTNNPETVQSL
jgi:anthranilate synthase/aminodeoxychorismate synthase-like glutamine amidotransferase